MLGLGGLGQAPLGGLPPSPPTAVAFFRNLSWHAPYALIGWRVTSPRGGVIRTGLKGFIRVPVDCVITRMYLVAGQTGSLTLDIWRSLAGTMPDSSQTITHDRPPTLSNAHSVADFTMLDWDTHLNAGDTLALHVVAASIITNFTIGLMVDRAL